MNNLTLENDMPITSNDILDMYHQAEKEQETFPACVRVFMVIDNTLKAVTSELPTDVKNYVTTHVLKDEIPCCTCGGINEVMYIHEDIEQVACVKCENELPFAHSDIEALPHVDLVHAFSIPLEKI
jgi:hypothetical protein